MNILLKVFGLVLVFQLTVSAAVFQNPDKITKSFSPKEKVEIKLVSGDCTIETGNSDQILVEIDVRVSDENAFKPNLMSNMRDLKFTSCSLSCFYYFFLTSKCI